MKFRDVGGANPSLGTSLKRLSSAVEREAYTLRQRRFDPVSLYQQGTVAQLGERPPSKRKVAGSIPAGSTNKGVSSSGKTSGSNPEDGGSIPSTPARHESNAPMTKTYIQCRLRRPHLAGSGHAEMVAYLPTKGTNGIAVEAGRSVTIASDTDARPWSIVSASGPDIDESHVQRKRREGKELSEAIR